MIAVLMAATPALAQGDILNTALESIGLKAREQDPIDYRERAPLVVPPDAKRLRSPEAPAAQRTSAWPQDPDILERKRKAAEANLPRLGSRAENDRPEQLAPGIGTRRNAYAGVPTRGGETAGGEGGNVNRVLTPDQVGRILANSKETALPSGVEPRRQYLTEPPKGYRQSAKGAPVKVTQEPFPIQNDNVQMNIFQRN